MSAYTFPGRWGNCMVVSTIVAVSLVVSVAAAPLTEPFGPAAHELSFQQKNAAIKPYLRSATECIARSVATASRFGRPGQSDLGDLIVDSMPKCLTPVHALIDAYDRYFGTGAGETFFMGPYLDMLPKAVSKLMEQAR